MFLIYLCDIAMGCDAIGIIISVGCTITKQTVDGCTVTILCEAFGSQMRTIVCILLSCIVVVNNGLLMVQLIVANVKLVKVIVIVSHK